MEYRKLGATGLKVSPLCLGAMNFPNPTDEETSINIIHAALDAGVNFIDTANVYSRGESERVVGKAIAGRRDQVVLATKVHGQMGPGPNDQGNSRAHILRECERSLQRLNTDYVDLYQMHRPDPDTPIEETLSALTHLVRQGKVRYLGSSTFPAWELCESLWVSDRRNLSRFDCEQPPYSILDRAVEKEVLPLCLKYGIGVIPWSPLEGGWLAGKYRRGAAPPPGSRLAREQWDLTNRESQGRLDAVEKLEPLARQLGKTISQLALAWLLANPAVTAPIIGPRTPEHLEDNLGALGWQVPPEVMKAIDEIVPPGTAI